MTNPSLFIDCPTHGENIGAVVCRHLIKNNGYPLGFIENCSDPDNLQGWCFACEYVYLQEQDKTQKFIDFNDMAIVCTDCYTAIKAKHDVINFDIQSTDLNE